MSWEDVLKIKWPWQKKDFDFNAGGESQEQPQIQELIDPTLIQNILGKFPDNINAIENIIGELEFDRGPAASPPPGNRHERQRREEGIFKLLPLIRKVKRGVNNLKHHIKSSQWGPELSQNLEELKVNMKNYEDMIAIDKYFLHYTMRSFYSTSEQIWDDLPEIINEVDKIMEKLQ